MGQSSSPSLPYQSTRKPGRYALNLLFSRWSGSLYKLVWRNLVVWLAIYYTLSLWYRLGMTSDQRRTFEMVSRHCEKRNTYIPLAFVLGFYVSTVIGRWWVHWDNLPWPDTEAFWLSCVFRGMDEQSVMLRKTVMRYMSLTSAYSQCLVNPTLRKKFPTLEHFVEAGLMSENERVIFERLSQDGVQKPYYLPIQWAGMIITRAKEITDESGRPLITEMQWKSCMDTLSEFRSTCSYASIIEIQNIPVVYSQIAALAVYAYSALCLLGRQFLLSDTEEVDMYFPLLTILELVFHWGWLKVAETMIDPYGEDDADIPLAEIHERNVEVSNNMAIKVLRSIDDLPDVVRDDYWHFNNRSKPQSPPYYWDKPAAKGEGKLSTDVNGNIKAGIGGGHVVDIGVDGVLADIPASRASLREMEERRQGKRTIHRIIGTVKRLQGSSKKSHNCRSPVSASDSLQQLCTVDSASDGDCEGFSQKQIKPFRQTEIDITGEGSRTPDPAKSEALVKPNEIFRFCHEVHHERRKLHYVRGTSGASSKSTSPVGNEKKSPKSGAIHKEHQHVHRTDPQRQ